MGKANKWIFKNSGIEPEYYSMLGAYSDKENERQLEDLKVKNQIKQNLW